MAAIDSETSTLGPTIKGKAKERFPRWHRAAKISTGGRKPSPTNSIAITAIQNAMAARGFIILLPFSMIVGIVVYRLATSEPQLPFVLVMFTVFAGVSIFRSRNTVAYLSLLLTFAVFGFSLMTMHSQVLGSKMLGYPIVLDQAELRVTDIVSAREDRATYIAQFDSVSDKRFDGVRSVRFTVRNQHFSETVGFGDLISGRIRFAPVPKPIVAGGYDVQFSNHFSGIGAYASSLGELNRVRRGGVGFVRWMSGVRGAIALRIDQTLGAEAAAIAKALIIGDQSDIPPELRNDIAEAGLAHVLAISGLHLTLVVGSALVLTRIFLAFLNVADRWIRPSAILIAIIVALAYLLVSGANLATQRATIMLLLAFGAMLFGRRAITMRNAALAGLMILCLFPAEVFKPGFQLSFAAVLGLVAAYSEFQRLPIQLPGWTKATGGLALTSLIAGAVTAPIAAFHFQQFAPFGLIGNLIAVPVVGFWVLPFGFLSVLLMPFGLEQFGLEPMGAGIGIVAEIARTIAQYSGDLTTTPVFAGWTLFAAMCALAWLSFFRGRFKLIGPAVFTFVFLFFGQSPPPLILISDTTQGVAVRGESGFQIVGRKSNSFTLRVWSERFDAKMLERDAVGNCDRRGCFAITDVGAVSVVKTTSAFHEDCGAADVLIVKMRGTHKCESSFVISQSQLDQNGVAMLSKDYEGKWQTAWAINDHNRPWRP